MTKRLLKSLIGLSTLLLVGCGNRVTSTSTPASDASTVTETSTVAETSTATETSSVADVSSVQENLPDFTDYKLIFLNKANKALKGLKVTLTGEDFEETKTTGIRGSVTFKETPTGDYTITVTGLPDGYTWETALTFDKAEEEQTFIATSQLRPASDYTSSLKYSAGDIMCDFYANRAWNETVDGTTTVKSESTPLSDILDGKDAVMLNFWGTWCGWCVREMPAFESFYQAHDNIGIYAVSDYDDVNAVATFKATNSLTFDMANLSDTSIIGSFGITGYPTTVVIDSYGLITKVHSGALQTLAEVETLMNDYID
ncbi:MAG: TlpA family protein disulfide reductase [Bacilli bacterium]|nr:TlpA family protein disulfide reductase [Bacilli bacterium]